MHLITAETPLRYRKWKSIDARNFRYDVSVSTPVRTGREGIGRD